MARLIPHRTTECTSKTCNLHSQCERTPIEICNDDCDECTTRCCVCNGDCGKCHLPCENRREDFRNEARNI